MARAKTVQFPQALLPKDAGNLAIARIPMVVLAGPTPQVITIPNEDTIYVITLGSALVMTLPLPVAGQSPNGGDDGTRLAFITTTAFAHVLNTVSGTGFNGTTGNTGTWAAAINNGIEIFAYNGRWYIIPGSNLNVTLSVT